MLQFFYAYNTSVLRPYPAIICQLPTKLHVIPPLYIISLCLLFLKVNINSKFT